MGASLRTEDVTAFHSHAEWIASSQEQADWLQKRKALLTASDVAAVMGEDELKSALDVYVDKRIDAPPERLPPWDPRVVGRVIEQPLLRELADYRGWTYRPGGHLLRSRTHPELGATLDAEVDRGDGIWCDLEGKTTELVGDWNEDAGEMPRRVLLQVQTQLLVTGAQVAIVFALLRRYKPVQIEVYPSPALHSIIVEYAEWFLDLVRRHEPPKPDGSESSRRALHRLYPAEDGSIVDLPGEAVEWTREYQEINDQMRDLEKRKRQIQNLLKLSIGPATFGLLPEDVGNKRCWRWQRQERKGHEVRDSESRVLRALKDQPLGARPGQHPQLAPSQLEQQLEASLEPAPVIRFGKRRRRSR